MDEQHMEEENESVTWLRDENKKLKNKVTELNGELASFTSEFEAMKQNLKKAEFERDSYHNQIESLKENIRKLSKELHAEKKQHKMTKIRLTELESQRGSENSNNQTSAQLTSQVSNSKNAVQASGKTQVKDLHNSLREAAEEAMVQSGFVFDERTGLYYDYSSNLYYDPNSRLYYDQQSGTYYYYDQESNSYKFHSQVNTTAAQVKEGVGTSKGSVNEPITLDGSESEGEIHDDDDKSDDDGSGEVDNQNSSSSLDTEPEVTVTQVVSAPCIRAIITCSSTTKVGTLFIVTCQGGTLGRDKDLGHVIRISDIELSKKHCLFEYDQTRRQYFIIDCGSRNGTFLNGNRLSESQESSADHVLTHGDQLIVGGTTLLLHIHPGNDTCDECEPGQVQAKEPSSDVTGEVSITKVVTASSRTSMLSLDERRKKQLKKLKKGYLLENTEYSVEVQDVTSQGKYKDRATVRRTKVGSDLPVQEPDAAPASVHRPIDSKNKGRKMLEKMGWKQGEGLGRESGGRTEPVTVQLRDSSRGLGTGVKRSLDEAGNSLGSRTYLMAKARERFAQIEVESNDRKNNQDFIDPQGPQSRGKEVRNVAVPFVPSSSGTVGLGGASSDAALVQQSPKPSGSSGTPVDIDIFAE